MEYELIDCGQGRRLERFGEIIVDRPAPQANWSRQCKDKVWQKADASFIRDETGGFKWVFEKSTHKQYWQMDLLGLRLELRFATQGQVGLFMEQLPNWRWLQEYLGGIERPLKILNAFGYTGMATLAASSAGDGIEVCHLDGAKTAVNWAKNNAALSSMTERPIRWIVDDVLKFMQREIKRGQKYDGFILDPPAFGHGPGGRWEIERDLPLLLERVKALLSLNPSFVMLSCHAPQITGDRLSLMLEEHLACKKCDTFELSLQDSNGKKMSAGVCARVLF